MQKQTNAGRRRFESWGGARALLLAGLCLPAFSFFCSVEARPFAGRLTLLPGAALGGQPRGEEAFRWATSYARGLVQARSARRPLLVYLPPTGEGGPPAVLRRAARVLGPRPPVEAVRVGAGEVAEVLAQFSVRRLPALLLVDRRERVLARWEGEMDPRLWASLGAALRRLRAREQSAATQVAAAERLLRADRVEAALRRITPLVSDKTTPFEPHRAARQLEERVVARQMADLAGTLAGEGLVDDRRLAVALKRLGARRLHPRVSQRLTLELRRLQTTVIPRHRP